MVLMFPGQGSQYVGMGAGLRELSEAARSVFAEAADVLGESLVEAILKGPEEVLRRSDTAQPAILTTSVAAQKALSEHGIEPKAVAGHSLGEYSALVAAGSLSFRDALEAVAERGRLMAAACDCIEGTMVALLGDTTAFLDEILEEASQLGIAEIANRNSPGQIVLSGEREALGRAAELGLERGVKKVVWLRVAGPFHTSLMADAAKEFARFISEIDIAAPRVTFVANVTGESESSPETIRSLLVEQICSTVQWEKSMRTLLAAAHDCFIDTGPGKVLKGLMARIDRSARVYAADSPGFFDEVQSLVAGTA